MLVQYLLYAYSYLKDDGNCELFEVDGIWGTKTSAALSVLERDPDYPGVPDGYITPLQSSLEPVSQSSASGKLLKMATLQYYYVQVCTGVAVNWQPGPLVGSTILAMPHDGVCPDPLAAALLTAM